MSRAAIRVAVIILAMVVCVGMYLVPPTTDPALGNSPVVYTLLWQRQKAVNEGQLYDVQWGMLQAQWVIVALTAGIAILVLGSWTRRFTPAKWVSILAMATAIRTLVYPQCWGDGPWLPLGREWLWQSGNRLATSLIDRELLTISFSALAVFAAIEAWSHATARRTGKRGPSSLARGDGPASQS